MRGFCDAKGVLPCASSMVVMPSDQISAIRRYQIANVCSAGASLRHTPCTTRMHAVHVAHVCQHVRADTYASARTHTCKAQTPAQTATRPWTLEGLTSLVVVSGLLLDHLGRHPAWRANERHDLLLLLSIQIRRPPEIRHLQSACASVGRKGRGQTGRQGE